MQCCLETKMIQQRKFFCLFATTGSVLRLNCYKLFQDLGFKHYYSSIAKGNDIDENDEKFRITRDDTECHFQLHKSKGQHLLTNARILDAIVKKSNIKDSDTVLEIGPGTGNLTLRLLQAARKVVAIELDRRMAEALQKRVSECGLEDRLHLICKDALKTEFPQFDLVVANIPYGISSPLIAKLIFGRERYRSATLLLQKEFARRLLANPGDSEFNRLAVNVKLVADVELVMDVSKRDFLPVPRVDSSVVVIRPKSEIPSVDLNEWCAFTRTCFCKKNKTLGATLKQKKKLMELMRISNLVDLKKENLGAQGSFKDKDVSEVSEDTEERSMHVDGSFESYVQTDMALFKEKIIEILRSSGYEDKRPSKLSVEKLLELLSLFNQNKIYFHDAEDASDAELAASFDE